MPVRLAYTFLGSFIISVFLLQWWQEPQYPWWIWALFISISFGGIVLSLRSKIGYLCIASACGIMIAFLSVAHATTTPDEHPIEAWAIGKTVSIEGTIRGQPDDRQIKMQYTVDVISIQQGTGSIIPINDRILLNDRQMRIRPAPGEMIKVKGRLNLPMDTEDFSYTTYLAMDGIHATMDVQTMTSLGISEKQILGRILWEARNAFETRINSIYPEPASSLLAGLLTGSRKGLPPTITDDFRRTGLSHIVAVSGSNITIILSVITGLLFFLPLKFRLIPSGIAIVIFTLFVGAEASVVRAAIMGILGLLALQTNRMSHIRLSILWTAFFILVWNPLQLWIDMGFQLSFLAVIGLAELRPLIEPITKHVPKVAGLHEALTTTLTAQLTAMPWAAYRFGLLSLISPIANVVIAPLMPIAMFGGFAGVIVGIIFEPLGRIVGLPGLLALEGTLWGAHVLAHIPLAAVTLPPISPVMITLYYIVLIAITVWVRRRAVSPLIEIHRNHTPKTWKADLSLGTLAFEAEGLSNDPGART